MSSVQCAGILITLDTWGSRTRRTSNVRKGLKWFKGLKGFKKSRFIWERVCTQLTQNGGEVGYFVGKQR